MHVLLMHGMSSLIYSLSLMSIEHRRNWVPPPFKMGITLTYKERVNDKLYINIQVPYTSACFRHPLNIPVNSFDSGSNIMDIT